MKIFVLRLKHSFLFPSKTYVIKDCNERIDLKYNLKKSEDVLNLKFGDIVVGDLVYDTYLRYSFSATVNCNAPFLYDLVSYAYKIYLEFQEIIDEESYSEVIVPYTTYIYFGIFVRVAVSKGMKVKVLGVNSQLFRHVSSGFLGNGRDFTRYKSDYDKILFTEELKNKCKVLLERRLNGEIDGATSYMNESAFKKVENNSSVKLKKKSVLVMLHCFFDSPHIYRNMVFSDFYEWITFILETSKGSPYDFFVKPHPNGIEGNDDIVNHLKLKYPHFILLDKNLSNLELANASFEYVLTVYGTCAHEFPYLGTPSLSCGDNPHVDFGFSNLVKDKGELKDYILGKKKIKKSIDPEEILQFYYMHNLSLTGDRINGDLLFSRYFKHFEDKELLETISDECLMGRIKKSYSCVYRDENA